MKEKKKGAVGVRAMKLGDKDYIDKVYYLSGYDEVTVEEDGVKVDLNAIRTNKSCVYLGKASFKCIC